MAEIRTDLRLINHRYDAQDAQIHPLAHSTDSSGNLLLQVGIGNGAADAFGRLRVSQPVTLFDSKLIHDAQTQFWDDQEVSGGGTSSVHSAQAARQRLSVSASTAGKRVRQTYQRFGYQSGKSHLVLMTSVLGSGGTGITAAVGYFDDNNGVFFKSDNGTLKAVIRSNVTGTPTDTEITSATCNGDPMDGTGPSGITIDPSKTQILWFDLEWLGVGDVRCGFVVNGQFHTFHQFHNTNVIPTVYMSTANLPLRYEIANDGTGDAATLDCICNAVISEGFTSEVAGIIHSANMGATFVNANTAGTRYALIGIRLKTTHLGVRVAPELASVASASNDNFLWELRLNPTVAGTFTYADYDTDAAVQIAYGDTAGNPSTNTVTDGELLASGYGAANSALDFALPIRRLLGASIAGTRDQYVLCVTPMSANADLRGAFVWREVS